jgi:LacI family transcriptional regulator
MGHFLSCHLHCWAKVNSKITLSSSPKTPAFRNRYRNRLREKIFFKKIKKDFFQPLLRCHLHFIMRQHTKNMKHRPTTLKDMAQQLNTSVATISRALKDKPDISADMRERVKALAAELNYQPNPTALNLKYHKSQTIGVVIPKVVHFMFSTMISGILEEAEKYGYNVLISESNQKYDREVRIVNDFMHGKVDGLIICFSNQTRNFAHIQQVMNAAIPLVMLDKSTDAIHADQVVVDDYEGAFAAVEHLVEQGYQRIAHINGNEVLHHSHKRMSGYLDVLKKHGMPVEESLIFKAEEFTLEEGMTIGQKLLTHPLQPDAVFSISDEVLIGVHQYLKQQNRRIPEEFGLVGFSNSVAASVIEPPLSSVWQPGFEMGKLAVRRLLELIRAEENDQSTAVKIHTLNTQLMVRKSSLRHS